VFVSSYVFVSVISVFNVLNLFIYFFIPKNDYEKTTQLTTKVLLFSELNQRENINDFFFFFKYLPRLFHFAADELYLISITYHYIITININQRHHPFLFLLRKLLLKIWLNCYIITYAKLSTF